MSFLSNGKGRMIAFLFVVLAAVGGVWRVESIAKDARDLAEQNAGLIEKIEANTRANEREAKARIDQSCALFERDHRADVEAYGDAIRGRLLLEEYVAGLSAEQRQEPLNALLIREAPQSLADYRKARSEALVDAAPDYCDEPGAKAEAKWFASGGKRGKAPIGLREPDPALPDDPFAKPG